MASPQLKCPSCNGPVDLGEIECPHCGVNLKSGESYEARVKRARGKLKHSEGLSGGLYLGVGLAFLLCTVGGYMYQTKMEAAIKERPHFFVGPIEDFQKVEDLVAGGLHDLARDRAKELVEKLEAEAESIRPRDRYARPKSPWARRRRKFDERGARRLLNNLKAKTEFKLNKISERGS